MEFFAKIFIFFLIMLFPLYLWAYSLTLTNQHSDSRMRFYMGLISGVFSVGSTFIFAKFLQNSSFLVILFVFLLITAVLYFWVYISSLFGSPFARGFLQKISFWHLMTIMILFLCFLWLSFYFLGNAYVWGIVFSLLIPAFFEEIAKHMGLLGLLGKSFRFSLRDLAIFSFCVTIGFTFVENFLYFYNGSSTAFWLLLRSILTFSAHLLALLICAFFWWKSLSCRFLSVSYFFWFIIGFISSVLVHFLFNWSLSLGYSFIAILYVFLAVWLFIFSIN